jgi:ferredoxin
MPKLTIVDHGTYEVPAGTRLINAIEDQGINILHRCGGYAKCTTCRVEFVEGEPGQITQAEQTRWKDDREAGLRLSCQMTIEDDMTVKVLNTLESTGLDSPGDRPQDKITPDPEWIEIQ